MKCPTCESTNHSVKETRSREMSIYRWRVCENCNHKWSTTETIIEKKVNVTKEFNNMINSIRKYK